MDQGLLAGIGNIYSDEILFAARLRPTRPANSLKEAEMKRLFSVIRPILKKAIRHRGTSFSDYVDGRGEKGNFTSLLKIYGRKAGEKCLVCGGPVKAVKIGGRTAKFCPRCQR
jgi:formamidopyrimidine-DNA glycosylase